MLKVSVSTSTHTAMTTTTSTGMMNLIQNLKAFLDRCDWEAASEHSRLLVDSGRELIIKHVEKNQTFNALPMTITLFTALSAPELAFEDEAKYHIARAARLFIELTCMKSVTEKRDIYTETQLTLREQLDKLLNYTPEEHVSLRYELSCSSEALKLMEKIDTKEYLVTLFEAAKDPSIGSVLTLLKLIPELIKKKSKEWFSEAIFLNWMGISARHDKKLFVSLRETLETNLEILEIAQTGVEFLGDIAWNGNPELQLDALKGQPGLLSLLNKKSQKLLPSKMWPVRYRAVQILSTLLDHPNPQIRETATKALLERKLAENKKSPVSKLFEAIEQRPGIRATWKVQFEAQKAQFIDQNLQEEKAIQEQESNLTTLEGNLSRTKTSHQQRKAEIKALKEALDQERARIEALQSQTAAHANRSNEQQTQIALHQAQLKKLEKEFSDALSFQEKAVEQINSQQKALDEERRYVQELREECSAHKENIEVLHLQYKKAVDEFAGTLPFAKPVSKQSSSKEEAAPPEFCCPISKDIMEDPWIAADGYSYEKTYIEQHLLQSNLSPITRLPLKSKELTPNRQLRDAIEQYTSKGGKPRSKETKAPIPTPASPSVQPASRESYYDLLIQLHDVQEIKNQKGLPELLSQLFEELIVDDNTQLTPKQEKTYTLVQKLYVNGKVATLVSSALIKMHAPASPQLSTSQPLSSKTETPTVTPIVPKKEPPKVAPVIASPPVSTMPSIAFGAAEWKKYFGDVGVEPPLPADIQAILSAPSPCWPGKKVQDTHLLVLVPQTVNGQPLTLKSLGELVKNPLQGNATQYRYFNIGEYADPAAPKSHWALLTRDVVEGSRIKPYSAQQALIKAPYEVPTILDAAVAIFMEHVRTGTRLYSDSPWTYTRCQEKYNAHWQLVVGGFSASGVYVFLSDGDHGYFGVGGLRKF